MSRPARIRVRDELGRWQTLPSGLETFDRLGSAASQLLLLGIGPDIAAAISMTMGASSVGYIEHAPFVAAMNEDWAASIPAHWQRVDPKELIPAIQESTVLLYRPNLRLYPSFWVNVWSRCRLAHAGTSFSTPCKQEIWFPGTERDLLLLELEKAFQGRGFTVRRLIPENLEHRLIDTLPSGPPALFLSINFRGLDHLGHSFSLLREAGVPVAVWCVDNPFHLLTRLRAPFWKECALLVTDPWFVKELRLLGASRVKPLPLAADVDIFHPRNDSRWEELRRSSVFVGRSRFPGKERFFAGCSLPEPLLAEAEKLLRAGIRPHFGWWKEHFGSETVWTNAGEAGSRRAGYGAEEATRIWRSMVLEAVSGTSPLTIYGDQGWDGLIQNSAELRGEVDYYGPLSHIYEHSGISLNLTSLLLPCGLNQRHFDVWAAGGFLLTDATPGLALFPRSLAREVTFHTPHEAAALARRFLLDPSARMEIGRAWREEILMNHTYGHRVDEILDWVYQPVP
jgi:hypothetical protein